MVIKPIKNAQDYRRAIKELDKLMDAKPNTPQGDRLDVLATLVAAWEKEHYPIEPPDRLQSSRRK